MSNENLPTRLYKYRSLQGKHFCHASRTVVQREVYFATAPEINDPFEFQFRLNAMVPQVVKLNHMIRFLQERDPSLRRPAAKREAKQILNSGDDASLKAEETQKRALADIRVSYGVFSLSVPNDNPLMWSHYADSHRGICIEFNPEIPGWGADGPFKVAYRNNIPVLSVFSATVNELLTATLLTKSSHWKYEEEWRYIALKSDGQVRTIPQGAITGIILGMKISSEDERKVRAWAENADNAIRIFRAVPDEVRYALVIREDGDSNGKETKAR